MRWHLLIEEFGPTIIYIKGPENIIANALSRLDLVSSPSNVHDMVDCYGLDKDDLPNDAFPITYQLINCKQTRDQTLLTTIKQGVKHYILKARVSWGWQVLMFAMLQRQDRDPSRTAKMSRAVVSPHSMPPRNQLN